MFRWIKEQFNGKEEDSQQQEDQQKDESLDNESDSKKEKIKEDLSEDKSKEVLGEDSKRSEEKSLTKDDTKIDQPGSQEIEDIQDESEATIQDVVESKTSQTDHKIEEKELEYNIIDKEPEEKKGFFQKIFLGLEKTRDDFSDKLGMILGSYLTIDDDMYEDLEDILITSDIGVDTTMELIDNLKERIKTDRVTDPNKVVPLLADEAKKLIGDNPISFDPSKSPTIILVVGVNGVGKTTTIGKLASKYKAEGKKVMLVAADTFRAAATEQLKEWSNRAGVDIIAQSEGADSASVVYDGIQAAKARKTDVVLVDTAGRLHNKANLMNELEKIHNVINREYPDSNKESLIVLDATTGQNAIIQAKQFKEVVDITGVTLTKLDGTARGGVVIPLIAELKLPVVYIGVGEQIDDLQKFDADTFIDSIFDINN